MHARRSRYFKVFGHLVESLLKRVSNHVAPSRREKVSGTFSRGHFVEAELTALTAMEKSPGWGDPVPEILRNDDWRYAVFTPAGEHRAEVNEAECLACHKPLTETDYVFTLEALQAFAEER